MLKTGNPGPHFFHWSSLPIYLNALAYIPYCLLGRALAGFRSPEDIPPPRQLDMGIVHGPIPTTILLGRLITLGFGISCVALAFLTGRQSTGVNRVGILLWCFGRPPWALLARKSPQSLMIDCDSVRSTIPQMAANSA